MDCYEQKISCVIIFYDFNSTEEATYSAPNYLVVKVYILECSLITSVRPSTKNWTKFEG